MKLLLLLLAASLPAASAFVAPRQPPSLAAAALRATGKSDAAQPARAWDELKQIERDLVVQQQVGDLDEGAASKAMAEKLLETALDYGEEYTHCVVVWWFTAII